MATLEVVGHLGTEELGRRYRAARDRVERGHLQVVRRRAQGRSGREVARIMGLSGPWVAEIVRRYNEAGPDGLGDRRRGNVGAKPLLGAEDEAALRAALAEPPSDGGLWTGPKVAAWMAARLGREVWPQRGWDYLKRLGYSARVPRPRHAEAAGAEEQAEYEKARRAGARAARGGARPRGRGVGLR
jgi:transposase